MINEFIEKEEYIKQLEKENSLLKNRILSNALNENTEIVRLNFKIESLENEKLLLKNEISNLNKRIALLRLQGR